MTTFESQVEYYKSSVRVYSYGFIVSVASVIGGVVGISENSHDGSGVFIGLGILVSTVNLLLWVRDSSRFTSLVRLR